jgi:hypothetical protein
MEIIIKKVFFDKVPEKCDAYKLPCLKASLIKLLFFIKKSYIFCPSWEKNRKKEMWFEKQGY